MNHASTSITVRVPIELEFDVPYSEYYERVKDKIRAEFNATESLISDLVKKRVSDIVAKQDDLGYFIDNLCNQHVAHFVQAEVKKRITDAMLVKGIHQAVEGEVAAMRKRPRMRFMVSINKLMLSNGTHNALSGAGIKTVGMLMGYTKGALRGITGLGKARISEIEAALAAQKLRLAD